MSDVHDSPGHRAEVVALPPPFDRAAHVDVVKAVAWYDDHRVAHDLATMELVKETSPETFQTLATDDRSGQEKRIYSEGPSMKDAHSILSAGGR